MVHLYFTICRDSIAAADICLDNTFYFYQTPQVSVPTEKTIGITSADLTANEVTVLSITITNAGSCTSFTCDVTCINYNQTFSFSAGNIYLYIVQYSYLSVHFIVHASGQLPSFKTFFQSSFFSGEYPDQAQLKHRQILTFCSRIFHR